MKKIDLEKLSYTHADEFEDSVSVVFNIDEELTHNGVRLVYPALYVSLNKQNEIIDTHIHCTETEINLYVSLENEDEILVLCKKYFNNENKRPKTKLSGEFKYGIGDMVYVLRETYTHPNCEKCSGEGSLELVIGGKLPCDKCSGSGINRWKEIHYYDSKQFFIEEIGVLYSKEEGKTLFYWGKDEHGYEGEGYKEVECYDTLEEAKRACEKRGQKVIGE